MWPNLRHALAFVCCGAWHAVLPIMDILPRSLFDFWVQQLQSVVFAFAFVYLQKFVVYLVFLVSRSSGMRMLVCLCACVRVFVLARVVVFTGLYDRQPADYIFMLLVQWITLLIIGYFLRLAVRRPSHQPALCEAVISFKPFGVSACMTHLLLCFTLVGGLTLPICLRELFCVCVCVCVCADHWHPTCACHHARVVQCQPRSSYSLLVRPHVQGVCVHACVCACWGAAWPFLVPVVAFVPVVALTLVLCCLCVDWALFASPYSWSIGHVPAVGPVCLQHSHRRKVS